MRMRYITIVLREIRKRVLPTKFDRTVERWKKDGGDDQLRFNYELSENAYVLDLGGYRGQWASDLYSMYRCKIVVFEPVNAFANYIEKRFKRNLDIKIVRCGLGGKTRDERIAIAADGSSIFRKSDSFETIRIVDVVDWLNDENIAFIDLIKINIEGGEYELLERLISSRKINMIRNIQVQFHDLSSDSETQMEKIREQLSRTHKSVYHYKFMWDSWSLRV